MPLELYSRINNSKINFNPEDKIVSILILTNNHMKNYFDENRDEILKVLNMNQKLNFNVYRIIVKQNPDGHEIMSSYKKLLESAMVSNFDFILAIGGGSVIDAAKFLSKETDSDMPICVIPTLIGAGTESSNHAVIYDGSMKLSIPDTPEIDTILYDDKIFESVPEDLKFYGRLDTMLHLIETRLNKDWDSVSEESKREWKEAVDFISKFEVLDFEMYNYSQFAGKLLNEVSTTIFHSISYVIAKSFNICHGRALAIAFVMLTSDSKFKASPDAISDFHDLYCKIWDLIIKNLRMIFDGLDPKNLVSFSEFKEQIINNDRFQAYANKDLITDEILIQMYEFIQDALNNITNLI